MEESNAPVKCPCCGSELTVRYGLTPSGGQRYECRNKGCEVKTFQNTYIKSGARIRFKPVGSGTQRIMSARPFYI